MFPSNIKRIVDRIEQEKFVGSQTPPQEKTHLRLPINAKLPHHHQMIPKPTIFYTNFVPEDFPSNKFIPMISLGQL